MLVKGVCRSTNKEEYIIVDYLYAGTFSSPNNHIKGLFRCDIEQLCDNPNECPIYLSAPRNINN